MNGKKQLMQKLGIYWGMVMMVALCIQPVSSWGQEVDTTLAASQISEAKGLAKAGNYEDAIALYEAAIPTFRKGGFQESYIRYCLQASELSFKGTKPAISRHYLALAERAAQRISREHAQLPRIYLLWGRYYQMLENAYEKSLKAYQRAYDLAVKRYGEEAELTCNIYRNLGVAYINVSQLDQAEKILKEAKERAERVLGPQSLITLESVNSLGILYFYQTNYQAALHQFLLLDTIIQRLPGKDTIGTSQIYTNIGLCYANLAMYDKSIAALEIALSKIKGKSLYDLNSYVTTLLNLGINYQEMGHYQKALYYAEKSYEEATNSFGRTHDLAARALNNIGIIYLDLGAYQRAKQYIDQARIIFEKQLPPHHYTLARMYTNLGEATLELAAEEEIETGMNLFKQVVAIYEHNQQDLSQAKALVNVGFALYGLDRFDEAQEWFDRSHAFMQARFGTAADTLVEMNAYHYGMGLLLLEKEQYEEVIKEVVPAVHIMEDVYGKEQAELPKYYHLLAKAYMNLKAWDAAEQQLQKAMEVYQAGYMAVDSMMGRQVASNPIRQLETLQLQGRIFQLRFEDTQDHQWLYQALDRYREADQLIQALNLLLGNYVEQAYPQQSLMAELYEGAIEVLYTLMEVDYAPAYFEEAFYFMEQNKSNTLLQNLTHEVAMNYAGIPASLVSREYDLAIDLKFFRSRLIEAERTGDSKMFREYQDLYFLAQQRHDSLIAVIELRYPVYHQLRFPNWKVSLEDLRHQIEDDALSIAYFWGEKQVFICWYGSDSFGIERVSETETIGSSIQQTLAATRPLFGLADTSLESYLQNQHGLFDALLGCIPQEVLEEATYLRIIPDGPIGYLSFDLLLPELPQQRQVYTFKLLPYLIHRYTISYAYSSRLQAASQAPPLIRTGLSYGGFAPVYPAPSNQTKQLRTGEETLAYRLFDLPYARESVSNIARSFDGEAHLGVDATLAAFTERVQNYEVLHLAMHAWLDDEEPFQSHLIFAPSSDTVEDRYLTVRELYGMSLPADLVVLGACNSASGKIRGGEGILSLARAFAYAGSPSLIGSLWDVPDAASAYITQQFFEGIQQGLRKDEALRAAKLAYLAQAPNSQSAPFHWAGYVAIGDVSPLVWRHASWVPWALIVGGLALVLGIFAWKKGWLSYFFQKK